MNQLTQKIKAKGYTLAQGVKALGMSMSTFRKYEKTDHKQHNDLLVWIDELEIKRGE